MIEAPGITVNGIKISPEQISAEVQYHPAQNLMDAKYKAMQALVIRELLIQQAAKLGLDAGDSRSIKQDELIDQLLSREIVVPEPRREECERYYNNNRNRFYTAPLFEASHILYLAPPENNDACKKAREQAENALKRLRKDPALFAIIAQNESACPSSKVGGNLGQIGKGQTVPAFEKALMQMREGDISSSPVATEVGYHIIYVHKRIEGKEIPFVVAQEWVQGHLREESWRRAFNQYIQILAGQAKISGFRLSGTETPLVQ